MDNRLELRAFFPEGLPENRGMVVDDSEFPIEETMEQLVNALKTYRQDNKETFGLIASPEHPDGEVILDKKYIISMALNRIEQETMNDELMIFVEGRGHMQLLNEDYNENENEYIFFVYLNVADNPDTHVQKIFYFNSQNEAEAAAAMRERFFD